MLKSDTETFLMNILLMFDEFSLLPGMYISTFYINTVFCVSLTREKFQCHRKKEGDEKRESLDNSTYFFFFHYKFSFRSTPL